MLKLTEIHEILGIKTEITTINDRGDMEISQKGETRLINRVAIRNDTYFTDIEGVIGELYASAYYGSKTPLNELSKSSPLVRVCD